MSKLFLHCGIHKTGTTVLQHFLAASDTGLRKLGFLVPKAGRVGPQTGHHNLAWQLTRDRRYRAHYGDLTALQQEIAGFPGDVIVSSEDFEGLLVTPERLAPFRELAAGAGRTLVLVLYVRGQASYLDSLFRECLNAGCGEEYEAFFMEALEGRRIKRAEWVFLFDFFQAAQAASEALGCELVVRNHHALVQGSIIADFLQVLGVPDGLVPEHVLRFRGNVRDGLGESLAAFYRNRVQRNLEVHERNAVALMTARLDEARNPPWLLREFSDAFVLSNDRLCRRYGVPSTGLVAAPEPPEPAAPNLVKLFSLETQLRLEEIAADIARQNAAATDDKVVDWRRWLAA